MTTLTYNLTRQQAADLLGISTRTIDRYVKRGRLSYKKVANKVLLAQEELDDLQDDFELLNMQEQMEISTGRISDTNERVLSTPKSTSSSTSFDVKEFSAILEKKDKTIEEKNQLIFVLQHKIGEMETQIKQMIALPDHSSQKEELVYNIQKLELEKQELENQIKKEKLRNMLYIGLTLVAAALLIFLTY